MIPYGIAFQHASPHGVITAVHIPDAPDPVPEEILALLPAEEAAHARSLRAYSQVQFVGGRIALRRACSQLGVSPPPILSTDRGAPVLPSSVSGSISHKRDIAVAMAGSAHNGTLGVDVENYAPARPGIAEHVLTEAEREIVSRMPDDRAWIALLTRFSIKESIYKALDPYVRRYVGFHEAEVDPDLEGGARVKLHLKGGEGPFDVEARYEWLHGRLLTSVRIRPSALP